MVQVRLKDFVITGSFSLFLQGVDLGREIGDIDMIGDIDKFPKFSEEKFRTKNVVVFNNGIVFEFYNIKSNQETVELCGFILHSADSILKWKLDRGSKKDLLDLKLDQ